MIQGMIVHEMKKHSENDDSDDDMEEAAGHIIFAPLQIMYESGSDEDN